MNREQIRRMRAEWRASDAAFKARLAALEEIKRVHLGNVARALPEVPPRLAKYLAEPNVFLRDEQSGYNANTNGGQPNQS